MLIPIMIIVSAGVCYVWAGTLIMTAIFGRHVQTLDRLPAELPPGHDTWPRLSIVVPACNEADTVEPAMRTLLAQDYPNLEIIAVEDRSTDGTRAVLQRLAAENSRLTLVPIDTLPDGWLGKNHALAAGADRATGEFILFADADVHMESSALRRAVAKMVADRLDHFTVGAEMIAHNWWERAVLSFFFFLFFARYRPWRLADPRSSAHIGIGAFNMVRAEPYRNAGGHHALAMEVIDDLMLGKMMKRSGGPCDFAMSAGMVRVRWVEGLSGLVRGLEKNAFAAFNFNPVLATIAVVCGWLFGCWPPIGLILGIVVDSLPLLLINLLSLISMPAAAWIFGGDKSIKFHHTLGYPVGASLMSFAILRSMHLTLRRGGIAWRGTFYPLATLRRPRH
jgi:hypothetical protein